MEVYQPTGHFRQNVFEQALSMRVAPWEEQNSTIDATQVWALLNPCGLNRALAKLVQIYRELGGMLMMGSYDAAIPG